MQTLDQLEAIVYSRIKYQFSESVKEKFPDIYFTTSDQSTDPKANFPCVYVHLMPSPENERSMDLERKTINGIRAAFQIEVSDNISQNRSRTVMNEVLKIMKNMMFETTTMPYTLNYNGVFRVVSRFSRNIDHNDVL